MSAPTLNVKAHILNVDGNWGTSGFRASALTDVVQKVHFCAHTNADNSGADGQPATNHWSLFMEISPARSVRIDISPGEPHKPGMIIIDIKTYSVTQKNVYDGYYVVPQGTTVGTILELIIRKGRDRYIFSAVGEGCRYWLKTLAWDMAEAHLLSSEAAQEISNALAYYWKYPKNSGYEPRAMATGTFF